MENYRMNSRNSRGCYQDAHRLPPKPEPPCVSMQPCPHHENYEKMALAMAYVPWQKLKTLLPLEKAMEVGTIFPELNKSFWGKGGCRK